MYELVKQLSSEGWSTTAISRTAGIPVEWVNVYIQRIEAGRSR